MSNFKFKPLLSLFLVFILFGSTLSFADGNNQLCLPAKTGFAVTDLTYYIDPGVTTYDNKTFGTRRDFYYVTNSYIYNIGVAIQNWQNATRYNSNKKARVQFRRVSNKSAAKITFKMGTATTKPEAVLYDKKNNRITGLESNQIYVKCIITVPPNRSNVKHVFAHEIGHCLGLYHCAVYEKIGMGATPYAIWTGMGSPNSVMITSDAARDELAHLSTVPTSFDADNVNSRVFP